MCKAKDVTKIAKCAELPGRFPSHVTRCTPPAGLVLPCARKLALIVGAREFALGTGEVSSVRSWRGRCIERGAGKRECNVQRQDEVKEDGLAFAGSSGNGRRGSAVWNGGGSFAHGKPSGCAVLRCKNWVVFAGSRRCHEPWTRTRETRGWKGTGEMKHRRRGGSSALPFVLVKKHPRFELYIPPFFPPSVVESTVHCLSET